MPIHQLDYESSKPSTQALLRILVTCLKYVWESVITVAIIIGVMHIPGWIASVSLVLAVVATIVFLIGMLGVAFLVERLLNRIVPQQR